MELRLERKYFTEKSTVGDLYVNDVWFCNVLEDKDRGLDSSMDLKEIKALKVYGETCIPYGTYSIVNSFSPRFKKYLPLLLNVPGYAGIRIHPGNVAAHTHGCLLPGEYNPGKPDFVRNSRSTFLRLMKLIKQVEKKEKITITITK